MNSTDRGSRTHKILRRTARWTTVLAVAVSPWLFGCAEPWAYLSIALLVNLATACWLLSLAYTSRFHFRTNALAWAWALFLLFVLLQLCPLPTRVVEWLNPLTATLQESRARLFAHYGLNEWLPEGERETSPALSLSVSAPSTRRSLYLLVLYAGVFFVMANTVFSRRALRRISAVLVLSAFIMALFALFQKFTGTREIYWYYTPRMGGTLFGPFTNRNHFAAYMNMSIGLTLGYLLSVSRVSGLDLLSTWREKLAWIFSERMSQVLILVFATVVMGSAVCLSLSRGGIAVLAMTLGTGAGVLIQRSGAPGRGRLVLLMALLISAMVAWLGWQSVVRRLGSLATFAADPLSDSRILATWSTLQLWFAAPWFGCGFGSFQHAFPMYQDVQLRFGRFLYAHNDYAQLLAEGGLVGAALLAVLIVVFLRTLHERFPETAEDAKLYVFGLLIGIGAIAIHSALDFSLRKPANGLLFVTLCGLAVSSVSFPRRISDRIDLDTARRPATAREKGMLGLAIAALLAISLAEARELQGELAFARILQTQAAIKSVKNPAHKAYHILNASEDAEAAMRYSGGNADAMMEIALYSLRQLGHPEIDASFRIRLADQAARAAAAAVRSAPSDYECWSWLGRAEAIQGHSDRARICQAKARELAPRGLYR